MDIDEKGEGVAMPPKRKRRPARGTFTYYRVRNADGLYLHECGSWGDVSSAFLSPRRAAIDKWDQTTVEPVRVVPLTDARRNKHRTR